MDERSTKRAVTLRDVADGAGVSVSTASRILDDRTPASTTATAARVREVAESLGYRRNLSASSLRRGATSTIGVLVPRLTDAVMALMYEALERAAHRDGRFAVVATCGDDPHDEQRAADRLLDRGVDGLVLATARLDDPLTASLRERQAPHALVLRSDRVSPSSLGDDEQGGYLAARHLVDLGHERIAVVTGPTFTSSGVDRRVGAERALAEAGLALEPGRLLAAGYGVADGVAAGRALLAGGDRPTAIFAANDNLALGVQRAAADLGLVVGRDLSIVGYNDIPLVAQLPVPLTSVRTAFDQIATTALDLLDGRIDPAAPRLALPTLIPRASTARPSF